VERAWDSLVAALNHLLSKQDLKRLTETYSVSALISLIQGFLIVPQCMPPRRNELRVKFAGKARTAPKQNDATPIQHAQRSNE